MTDEEQGEPLAYDMGGWEPEERVNLGLLLDGAGIAHSWDGDELLVPEDAEEQVDELMDRIDFPDALEAAEADGTDDEAVYAVMSDLYVAADRLAGADGPDEGAVDELRRAVAAAAGTPPPYGVAPPRWLEVQRLAGAALAAADAGDTGGGDGAVEGDAGPSPVVALRDVLRDMV